MENVDGKEVLILKTWVLKEVSKEDIVFLFYDMWPKYFQELLRTRFSETD